MANPTEPSVPRRQAPSPHEALELNRLFSFLVLGGVAVMVPWTAFLAATLPARFSAHNWSAAWVGFDVALIAALLATAWAAWHRRQVLAATAVVTATMLLCDAWFDITTSWGTRGLLVAITTALVGNVPLALLLFWLARRILLRTADVIAHVMNRPDVPRHAIEVSFPFAVTWPDAFPHHRDAPRDPSH